MTTTNTQFNGAQTINQFQQGPVQGQLDERTGAGQTLPAQMHATCTGTGVPGTALTVVDEGGGIPKVIETQTTTADVFGFIAFDKIHSTFPSGTPVDVACLSDTVMYMSAGAAISRNAKVMLGGTIAAPTVVTQTSTNTIVGRALDKAFAAGDLIRVAIDLPGRTAQP